MQFKNLETKSDFIDYCLNKDKEILDIDTVIPADTYRECKLAGICTAHLVTIYYKNSIAIENIIAKATIICLKN